MSSMNRSMLSPTFAESGDRAMLAAAMVSAALRMLVIMSGFLRGEEVDAVLQFVCRQHAVSDRDRAPRSEERRVGEACGRKCRSRLSPYTLKNKTKKTKKS